MHSTVADGVRYATPRRVACQNMKPITDKVFSVGWIERTEAKDQIGEMYLVYHRTESVPTRQYTRKRTKTGVLGGKQNLKVKPVKCTESTCAHIVYLKIEADKQMSRNRHQTLRGSHLKLFPQTVSLRESFRPLDLTVSR